VTWNDALAYANWAGKRLPTETEWEIAARGRNGWAYAWGDEWDGNKAIVAPRAVPNPNKPGTVITNIGRASVPAALSDHDISAWGCLHMIGNVREWVFDPWVPRGPGGEQPIWLRAPIDHRVVRGSSWRTADHPQSCHAAMRVPQSPSGSTFDLGFRCAKSVTP
jgi:formylglycine-generating enzyme required for sulfatase activity